MPNRAKRVDRVASKLPSIPKELVSLFLTGPMTGEAIHEAGAAFKKALIEASLNADAVVRNKAVYLALRNVSTTLIQPGSEFKLNSTASVRSATSGGLARSYRPWPLRIGASSCVGPGGVT